MDHDSTNFPKTVSLCNFLIVHQCLFLSAICILCGAHCPMTGWVCQWKPFWIPVDDSFKKAYNGSSRSLILLIFPFPEVRGCYSRNSKGVVACLIVTMGSTKPEVSACSRERIEAPLPPLQPRPTCDRLELPFSCDAILSGYEDLHLPGSDQFTMWGKMTPDEILTEHVVDIHRIEADFRDASERIQASSSQTYGVNKYFSSNHLCRRGGSAFTTGTLGPDEVRNMLSRNKLQESGISLPYKKLLTMSNTESFMNDFT